MNKEKNKKSIPKMSSDAKKRTIDKLSKKLIAENSIFKSKFRTITNNVPNKVIDYVEFKKGSDDEIEVISLMRKKGIFEILSSLLFFPKRYNHIKEELVTSISARTLDHRLNDLIKTNLIEGRTLLNKIPEGTEYRLTSLGFLVQNILSTLFDFLISEHDEICTLNNKENLRKNQDYFTNLFLEKVNTSIKFNWFSVWKDICKILNSFEYIETISHKKRNYIEEYDNERIIVTTEKGTKPVEVEDIIKVWNNLLQYKELDLIDYEKTTYRSSFICSLLSHLDYVEVIEERRKSIRLILNNI